MRRAAVALGALMLSALLLPRAALAQYGGEGLGSAVNNDAIEHQGRADVNPAEMALRGAVESEFKIIKDVKLGLHDADPNVRVTELTKLRPLKDPEADRILITQGLTDPDLRVKIKAVDLLGARQTAGSVRPMSQMLFLRSTEPIVKLHLVAALGRIGDTDGALPVMQYLEEETDARARGTAVFALGEIGDERSLALLSKCADEDPSPMVQRLAKEALQKVDGELPTQRVARATEQHKLQASETTEARLAKLREVDQKIQDDDR
ncbi:MAG TPA: HEAT repeat domain-containing protein [Candidatus Binataceae bacterium]|nr:HEAT repeat domain-containing protein [Candidatus Binataceae bacterium]